MGEQLLKPHGGYQGLKAFQMAEIVFDATHSFCKRFYSHDARMTDQMVQAARSGKQNIAEGSQVSATSSKSELFLIGVARGSLEELFVDYKDFLRLNGLELWSKDHEKAQFIRELGKRRHRTYTNYRTYIEDKSPESAANTVICLIHQTTYLIDQLKRQLAQQFELMEDSPSASTASAQPREAIRRNLKSSCRKRIRRDDYLAKGEQQ